MFDDIRLTDDVSEAEAVASQNKKLDLHRRHGMILERKIEERKDDLERGVLVFGDGTEVPFTFEVLGETQFRYTLDGETFELGGDAE